MSTPRSGTIIYGIGDEIVYSFGGFVVGFFTLLGTLFHWHTQRLQPQTIHAQSEDNVRDTRERLNVGDNAETTQHTTANTAGQQNAQNGQQEQPQPRRPGVERTCPICLTDAEFAIETNCSHTFCGLCIVTYWRHGNWRGNVRCPCCRQQVTVLLRNFTEEEQRASSERKTVILRDVSAYNRRYSGEPVPWIDYLRDLPTMLRYTATEFFSVGGLLWMYRLRIIFCFFAAFIYFVSPLDVIPEAAFGLLGFIDDLFILLLLAIYISIIYRTYLANRDYQ